MVTPQELMYLNDADNRRGMDEFGSGFLEHQLTNHPSVNDIPIAAAGGDNFSDQIQPRDMGRDIAKEYGINISKPKYQQFAIKDVRLKTFQNWPLSCNQRPEDLAEAGFFYSGKSDAVFCFDCGQGLQDWEDEDTPWGEHARWSPECPYLLNTKGRDFVRLEHLRDTDPVQYIAEKTQAVQVMQNRPAVRSSENDTWNNPAVESLLQNGYGKEMVHKAIFLFRNQRGENAPLSAAELLNIIFDLEEGTVVCEDVEKKEADLQRDLIRKENEELRKSTYCRKCSTQLVSVVFLPCGHLCTCTDCAPSVKNCLMCGAFIKGTIRTYLV